MNAELLYFWVVVLISCLFLLNWKKAKSIQVDSNAPIKNALIPKINPKDRVVLKDYVPLIERFVASVEGEFSLIEVKITHIGMNKKCEIICSGLKTIDQLRELSRASQVEFNTLKNKVEMAGSELVTLSYYKNYGSLVYSGISFYF